MCAASIEGQRVRVEPRVRVQPALQEVSGLAHRLVQVLAGFREFPQWRAECALTSRNCRLDCQPSRSRLASPMMGYFFFMAHRSRSPSVRPPWKLSGAPDIFDSRHPEA